MQRGPKPIPTNLRMLQGSRVDPARSEPIPPASDMPQPPAYLTPLALEEWNRLAEDLYGMGILTTVDLTALAAYCMAYAHWRKAEADLKEIQAEARATKGDKTRGGALLETSNGNLVQNPLIGIVNVARRDMIRIGTEFGLTPSSRTLIDMGKRGETDPVATKYFRGR